MFIVCFSDKQVDGFRLHFGLNIEYGGIYKEDVSSLSGVPRGPGSLPHMQFEISLTKPMQSGR